MLIKWKEYATKLLSTLWDEQEQEATPLRMRAKGHFLLQALPWALLLLSYVWMILYMAENWAELLNSDMSGEMILASQLNKTGGILSADWYYSTELRVLNIQLIYRLGLLLFPNNWHMARVLSVAVLLFLLAICYLFFFKTVGLRQSGVWAAALLMCPFSHWYAVYLLVGCYYVPHIAFSLLSLSMLLRYCREERSKIRRLWLTALGGIAFLSCLGGIRQLQICYVPAFVASLFWDLTLLWPDSRHFSRLDGTKTRTFTLRHNLGTFTALFCGGVGYFVNSAFLSKEYWFGSYGGVTWREFSFGRMLDVISDLVASFGFAPETRLISRSGIASFIGLTLGIMILAACFRLFYKRAGLPLQTAFLLDVFLAMLVVNVVSLSQLNSLYHASYLVPLLPFAFLMLFFEIRQDFPGPLSKSAALLFVCASVLLSSYCTLSNPGKMMRDSDAGLAAPSNWLAEHGYTQGYAKFWQGGAMVEYTSGKLEIWNVCDAQTLQIDTWLQLKAHSETAPEADAFLLLPWFDVEKTPNLINWIKPDRSNLLYDDGSYFVVTVDPGVPLTPGEDTIGREPATTGAKP